MRKYFTSISFASFVFCTIVALKTSASILNGVIITFAALNAFFFMLNLCSCIESGNDPEGSPCSDEPEQPSEAAG